MANAHALLSRNHWHGVSLADIVNSELAPYVGAGSVAVAGPDVMLTTEATQPVAIVLHELVTNASKYGALTSPQGRITVHWDFQQARGEAPLVLNWIERGGPACHLPRQSGYGTRAIRSLIPYELGGSVELDFASDGVCCRIELPAKCIGTDAQITDDAKDSIGAGASAATLSEARPQ
jgi:two-component sensor histidine kinase